MQILGEMMENIAEVFDNLCSIYDEGYDAYFLGKEPTYAPDTRENDFWWVGYEDASDGRDRF